MKPERKLKKVMVLGEIKPINSREWAFVAPDPKKGKLPRSLKQIFGKDVPQLKKCQCLTEDEYQALMALPVEAPEKGGVSKSETGGSSVSEKEINQAIQQLESDPTAMSDQELARLSKNLKLMPVKPISLGHRFGQEDQEFAKGEPQIEKKVAGSDMRKDVIKRFKPSKELMRKP